eukprot:TRINITY_DN18240_c0_g1_i4.p1 TRINITY_DN18240_c0_g1~~TRINITY_DN18240_c0_g1_i4.p1  ORF type:complete len:273 (-),score=34.18 TRINITY_DN18240_c0_g1_i4:59-877(-)
MCIRDSELGEERPAVTLSDGATVPAYIRMGIGPNQWPAYPEKFRESMSVYFAACCDVATDIMRALSEALGLQPGELEARFCADGAHARYKPACYRPVAEALDTAGVNVESKSLGLGAHKDFGFLSLLLQNDVGGLEVQRADDGVWIEVPPIPGTLVVNLGEMAELLSAGLFVASTHRVRPPVGQCRVSIPVFFNPSLTAVVRPVVERLTGAGRRRQMDGTADNRIIAKYGQNWVKGFARSQPAWFQRHMPDVFAVQQQLQPTAVKRQVRSRL